MENKALWNAATKAIAAAIEDHEKALAKGRVGVSLPARIYNRLVKGGFLSEKSKTR